MLECKDVLFIMVDTKSDVDIEDLSVLIFSRYFSDMDKVLKIIVQISLLSSQFNITFEGYLLTAHVHLYGHQVGAGVGCW